MGLIDAVAGIAKRAGVFVARYHPGYSYVDRGRIAPALTLEYPPEFRELAEPVWRDGRTMLEEARLHTIWRAIHNTARLGLPMAEVGTHHGGTAYFMQSAFQHATGSQTPMHVYDTFEGHPDKITEHDTGHAMGMLSDPDFEDVKAYLAAFDRIEVHKGAFPESASGVPPLTYGLVHLDVDIYQPTLDGLRHYTPLLAPSGVIVVDDYGAPKCPGVQVAVEEFMAEDPPVQLWFPPTRQAVLVKLP